MMSPNVHSVTCDICGGTGMGDIETAAAAWDSNVKIVHADVNVCRRIIALRNKLAEIRIPKDEIDMEQHF